MRANVLVCPAAVEAERCPPEQRGRKELETVVSQLGRPDDGTDVSGFYNIELFAPLAPHGHDCSEPDEAQCWRSGVTKAKLTDELSAKLRAAFPGVIFNFSQMISDNV